MGWYLFAGLLAAEAAAIAFARLKSGSARKIRSIVFIGPAAIFGLLLLIGAVQWGWRYYLLAAVLLAMLVSAGLNLFRPSKGHSTGRAGFWLGAAGRGLLFFAACLPVILFPPHPALLPTGPHPVARFEEVFSDSSRIDPYAPDGENRSLRVEFWYPADGQGTYPLVLFSHGSLGVRTSNETLYTELASHGYVIAAPDHTGQAFFTRGAQGQPIWIDQGYVNELIREDARNDPETSLRLYQKWMGIRVGDLNFLLDEIKARQSDPHAPAVYRLIDSERIGLIGHSLGGSAVLGLGRLRREVRAVISLEAPFMADIQSVQAGQFSFNPQPYPAALLHIYSDSLWGRMEPLPQYGQNLEYLRDEAPLTSEIYLQGATYLSLTDFGQTSPILTRWIDGQKTGLSAQEILTQINRISLAFFDCTIKGIGEWHVNEEALDCAGYAASQR